MNTFQIKPYFSLTLRFFIAMAALGLTVAFLRTYADFFNALFLAQLVALTASPLIYWLNRRLPRWLALGIGMVTALSVTLFVAVALLMSAVRMIEALPALRPVIEDVVARISSLTPWLGVDPADLSATIDTRGALALAARLLQRVLQSVSVFSLMILILVFMVVEAFIFPVKVESQIEQGNPRFLNFYEYTHTIRRYVGLNSLFGVIGGTILGALLAFIGVPSAILWGMLYFVMNFVPMVGFWIALIPPVVLAGLQFGPATALLVLLAYMIVSFVINQVLRPGLMGNRLDLSPLWSILSLVIWSTILGPVGLIVGVPLTIAVKELVLENDPESQWLVDLMSATARREETEGAASQE